MEYADNLKIVEAEEFIGKFFKILLVSVAVVLIAGIVAYEINRRKDERFDKSGL